MSEIADFLRKPEAAPYVQRELDARNREKRGFLVIAVYDEGATIVADLRGVAAKYADYSVVRKLSAIAVPSLGGQAKPEKWIANVQLKHVHNSVGHFVVQGKRWQEGKPSTLERSLLGNDRDAGTVG